MPFTLIVLTIFAVLYGYIAIRVHKALPVDNSFKKAALFYLFISWFSSPIPIVLRMAEKDGSWSDLLTWAVYLNMGFLSLIFVLTVLTDLSRFLFAVAQRVYRIFFIKGQSAESNEAANPERRTFMTNSMNLGLLAAGSSLTAVGIQQAVGVAVVREVNVPIGNLPPSLKDLRIIQLTDMHIGPMIKREYVEKVVGQVNQLRPDIIVMTGDLVDGSVSKLKDDVAPLAQLRARYGKFFITGNHEYYSGVEAWIKELDSLGFITLLNEHRLIKHEGSRLLLAGVTDYRAHSIKPSHQSDPFKAIEGAPESDVKILLAHQPKSIFEATKAGFDLQISGHTHGGQYYPVNFFARMVHPYIKGLHKHEGKTWIYVSTGTGYWGPPIRLGTDPEITMFRLS